MPDFKVIVYEKENGEVPVEKFSIQLIRRCVPRYMECLLSYKRKEICSENHTVSI